MLISRWLKRTSFPATCASVRNAAKNAHTVESRTLPRHRGSKLCVDSATPVAENECASPRAATRPYDSFFRLFRQHTMQYSQHKQRGRTSVRDE